MYQVHCLNNIAKVGTDELGEGFTLSDQLKGTDAIMVRSASLHEVEDGLAVGDIDRCPSELLIEGRVVQQIQVLEHEQSCRLVVRIHSQQGTQVV